VLCGDKEVGKDNINKLENGKEKKKQDVLGVSPTHDASEIIINNLFIL